MRPISRTALGAAGRPAPLRAELADAGGDSVVRTVTDACAVR
ncbi:hypothetical protein ACIQM0_16535 [Streptomyces sp. NPDC091387]